MWAELKNPRHLDFYRDLHESQVDEKFDWMPMFRAIEYLQSQSHSEALYGFTSMAYFRVTTAPSYREQDRHSSVGIGWDFKSCQYGLQFGASCFPSQEELGDLINCPEASFSTAIDSLILRLLRG